MNKETAQNFLNKLKPAKVKRYTDYWNSIKPVTEDDIFRRYLFAYTSVHTTWTGNIKGYNAIKDLGWLDDKSDLLNRLSKSGCGLHNNRTEYIWDFKNKFYANPKFYYEVDGTWQETRNKIVASLRGLGIAKVSFALEMCFPESAEVSCIDVHGIRLYGLTVDKFGTKKGVELYETIENHWVDNSKKAEASSCVARSIYWDEKQKKKSPRYWTYVLEN